MTKLAEYCRAQRFGQHLSLGDLARKVGATNISKVAGRISSFEQGGDITEDLLHRIVTALGIDQAVVEDLQRADQEDFERRWNAWADEPIRPHLVARLIPRISRDVVLLIIAVVVVSSAALLVWYRLAAPDVRDLPTGASFSMRLMRRVGSAQLLSSYIASPPAQVSSSRRPRSPCTDRIRN